MKGAAAVESRAGVVEVVLVGLHAAADLVPVQLVDAAAVAVLPFPLFQERRLRGGHAARGSVSRGDDR